MQYKDGKIIQIIQEFSVLGNTYNLNGIDLINAVFFVREDRKKFRLLLPAEYKITVDGTNVNLEIQDGVLNNCISVQVGIDLNKLFDLYDPVGSPDIVVLKDKYNQLCQDMANLWEYVKKQGVSSDALNRDIVLPILKDGETFVMRNGNLEAIPLVVAEEELQNLLDELIKKSQDVLDDYVVILTENSKTEIIQFFEDNKGNFLNRTEIREEINYLSGAEYKGNNIFGSELKNIIKGQMYYYGNIPYMAKVTATSSTGFLAPDTINFHDIRNVTINDTLYKELLEFDKYMYSAGGSNFFKFFRYGKRATFFISYTLSGESWSEYTKLANYATGFKPNTEYVYSEHKIYIQTSNNTGDERLVLRGDGIIIAGIAGKQVYKVIGVIEYIAE